jgi:hypothetical protein
LLLLTHTKRAHTHTLCLSLHTRTHRTCVLYYVSAACKQITPGRQQAAAADAADVAAQIAQRLTEHAPHAMMQHAAPTHKESPYVQLKIG